MNEKNMARALVNRLVTLTRAGKLQWQYDPTMVARTSYRGIEFVVDLPREGFDRTLLVNDVLVWKGFGLEELNQAIMDSLPGPEVPDRSATPPDYRTPKTVALALKILQD